MRAASAEKRPKERIDSVKKASLLVVFLLIAALPAAAQCVPAGDIYWGGTHSYNYVVDNKFANNCSNWQYVNSGRYSTTGGICGGIYSPNYARFAATGATDRVYQVVHIPGPGDPNYDPNSYMSSTHWTVAFHYEMSTGGTWYDNVKIEVTDEDTGYLIFRSDARRGDNPATCFNPGWSFTADLRGKNVRVSLNGFVQTSSFKWKLTDVDLIQGP